MYKVFIKDIPIILSTEMNIGKQYTAIPLKDIEFKKLIKDIQKGKLEYVNLYDPDEAMLETLLLEKLPVVTAAGGLVSNSRKEFLFIKRNKRWDLPKGRVEKKEKLEDAAIREVEEETGIKELVLGDFITKTYHVFKRDKKWKLKVTYWYAMHSDYKGELVPQEEEGIKKVRWKNFEQSQRALKNTYENVKLLFPKEYLLFHPKDKKKYKKHS